MKYIASPEKTHVILLNWGHLQQKFEATTTCNAPKLYLQVAG